MAVGSVIDWAERLDKTLAAMTPENMQRSKASRIKTRYTDQLLK